MIAKEQLPPCYMFHFNTTDNVLLDWKRSSSDFHVYERYHSSLQNLKVKVFFSESTTIDLATSRLS